MGLQTMEHDQEFGIDEGKQLHMGLVIYVA